MFFCISVISHAEQPFESLIEVGYIFPNGVHLGGSFQNFYFGFNVLMLEQTTMPTSVMVTDGTVAGTRSETIQIDATKTTLQLPIGIQYLFGSFDKPRAGFRIAWIPTYYMRQGSNQGSVSGQDTFTFLGTTYYWDGHNWLTYEPYVADDGFNFLIFEIGFVASFKPAITASISSHIDFSNFQNTRFSVAVGFSLSRIVQKYPKRSISI
jgi:hypothetical protein